MPTQSFLDITTGEVELMTSRANNKMKQQPVLVANVVQILAELHQLATANARPPLTDNQTGSVRAPTIVIRGKQAVTSPHRSASAFRS